MKIAGKVFVFTPPDGKFVRLMVRNDGDAPLGLTNNYFPTVEEGRTSNVHDDLTYGHGMECQPGRWSWQEFPLFGRYNTHRIEPGGQLRVGLRDACFTLATVPEPGAHPVELDLGEDFEWYKGSPESAESHIRNVPTMQAWNVPSMHRNTHEADPAVVELRASLGKVGGGELGMGEEDPLNPFAK